MKKLFASLAIAAVVAPVWAATQTVTLSVPGMTCSACPITVKKAISKVEGVSKVRVCVQHPTSDPRSGSVPPIVSGSGADGAALAATGMAACKTRYP
ncbi:cation transporter [Novosphingobium arvoryzae]|uniref:HMA domain-containing protein n=1 Tax=Novosphingobium arvoryzae TaxID=1256514 RepID=A0A918RAG0_9SPHN|nr:hypothetical protein GCM10011617_03960 [Novosphingobium arvoryzae]